MVTRRSFSPSVCAAFGAAIGYYVYSRLYHAGVLGLTGFYMLLLVPLAVLCLSRALIDFPLYSNLRELKIAARYILAFFVGLCLGIGAGGNAQPRLDWGLPTEKITAVSGVLAEDPRLVSGGRAMAVLKLSGTAADGALRASARGEIPVLFPGEHSARLKEFGRETAVFASGIIYYGSSGNAGKGTSGPLFIADSLHITKPAPRLEMFRTNVCNSMTQRFTARESQGKSWGALSLALLLGIRDNLDSGFTGLFRGAGCSYLLALSGMHLAVIAAMIALLLKKPLGQNAAAIAGALIITAYCVLVGPLPSLYRSGLMYLLGALAIIGSLKRDAVSVLCMAFIIQITVSPSAGYSISFILSYLALIGILLAGESLRYLFRGKIPEIISGSLSMSIGAFLLTAGVSVYYFGMLRPVGILCSLIMTPLITVFMTGSIIWLLLDFISPVLSGILSPLLSLLYSSMEKTALLSAHAPPLNAGFWPVLALSLVLSVCIILLARRTRVLRNTIPAFG